MVEEMMKAADLDGNQSMQHQSNKISEISFPNEQLLYLRLSIIIIKSLKKSKVVPMLN
jgi:hypothetical protein